MCFAVVSEGEPSAGARHPHPAGAHEPAGRDGAGRAPARGGAQPLVRHARDADAQGQARLLDHHLQHRRLG